MVAALRKELHASTMDYPMRLELKVVMVSPAGLLDLWDEERQEGFTADPSLFDLRPDQFQAGQIVSALIEDESGRVAELRLVDAHATASPAE